MANNRKQENNISFNIEKHIRVLSTASTGWKKELNLISWNGGQPKFDIRDWSPNHEHMSRGITLRREEAETLGKAIYRELNQNRAD